MTMFFFIIVKINNHAIILKCIDLTLIKSFLGKNLTFYDVVVLVLRYNFKTFRLICSHLFFVFETNAPDSSLAALAASETRQFYIFKKNLGRVCSRLCELAFLLV